jgi:hypothetical protein
MIISSVVIASALTPTAIYTPPAPTPPYTYPDRTFVFSWILSSSDSTPQLVTIADNSNPTLADVIFYYVVAAGQPILDVTQTFGVDVPSMARQAPTIFGGSKTIYATAAALTSGAKIALIMRGFAI